MRGLIQVQFYIEAGMPQIHLLLSRSNTEKFKMPTLQVLCQIYVIVKLILCHRYKSPFSILINSFHSTQWALTELMEVPRKEDKDWVYGSWEGGSRYCKILHMLLIASVILKNVCG